MKNNLLYRLLFLIVCFGLTAWVSAQTVYQIEAGDNAIGDALLEASAGDIIELTTSGGVYTDSATHEIMFDITIRAAEGLAEKPIIDGGTNDPIIDIIEGGLTVKGIKFMNGGYVITSHSAEIVNSSDFSLKVYDCEFHNWTERAIYTSDDIWTPLDSILVKNSIFMDGVKQAFYLKSTRAEHQIFPGGYKYGKIENCLITGLSSEGDGHATYIEPGNRDVGDQGWPTIIIDHVTVDNCWAGIYTYTTPGALVQNCIVTNLKTADNKCYDIQSGRWTTDPLPPASTLKNSIYSGGRLGLTGGPGVVIGITENVDSVAPVFVNAAKGNYALAEGSPGKGAGTDGQDIGFLGPYPVIKGLPVVICPGFEEDTVFNDGAWSSDWENSSINTTAAYVHSGSKSLKIGPGAGGRAQYPAVDAVGSTVSLLAWGKVDGELNEPAWIGFVAIDEFGFETEAEGTSVGGPEMIPMDQWTRLCASMTIPEGTVELRVYIWYSGDLVNNTASVYVDDYEFKWGDSCVVEKVDELTYNSQINVYPNPTEGRVYVSVGKDLTGISSIEIFDVTGKIVSRLNDLNGREVVEVDLSSCATGVYFGMVKTQNSTYSFKIIRK